MLTGTDTLAGSVANMYQCVANLREFADISAAQAVEAATLAPAKALGIEDIKGVLAVDADADFVLLDPETLEPTSTYIGGHMAWVKNLLKGPFPMITFDEVFQVSLCTHGSDGTIFRLVWPFLRSIVGLFWAKHYIVEGSLLSVWHYLLRGRYVSSKSFNLPCFCCGVASATPAICGCLWWVLTYCVDYKMG